MASISTKYVVLPFNNNRIYFRICYKCISIITCLSESNFRTLCSQNNMEIDYMCIRNEINKLSNSYKPNDSEVEAGAD